MTHGTNFVRGCVDQSLGIRIATATASIPRSSLRQQRPPLSTHAICHTHSRPKFVKNKFSWRHSLDSSKEVYEADQRIKKKKKNQSFFSVRCSRGSMRNTQILYNTRWNVMMQFKNLSSTNCSATLENISWTKQIYKHQDWTQTTVKDKQERYTPAAFCPSTTRDRDL